MDCSSSQEISKPPSSVFAFLNEWENIPLWLTESTRFEPLNGDPGTLGSTGWITLEIGSFHVRLKQEITAFEEDRSLQTQWIHFALEIIRSFELTGMDDEQTRLDATFLVRPRNLWGYLMLPFIRQGICRHQQESIVRLKRALEAVDPA